MAYAAPRTWSPGEYPTAAQLNQDLRDNVSFLANPPACRVYNNANISIGDASQTALTFNSERYDTDSMHSTSSLTGRITFNTAGLYLVTFSGAFASSSDYAYASMHIRLNSSTILARESKQHNVINADPAFALTTVYKFTVGQWVDVVAYQDNTSAAARNVEALGNYSPEFSAIWVGLG